MQYRELKATFLVNYYIEGEDKLNYDIPRTRSYYISAIKASTY